jgi:hypothetical protein
MVFRVCDSCGAYHHTHPRLPRQLCSTADIHHRTGLPKYHSRRLCFRSARRRDCRNRRLSASPFFQYADASVPQLAKDLCSVSSYFTSLLSTYLHTFSIPPDLLSLPHITSSTPQLPSSPHAVLDHSSPPPSAIVPIHCTLARSLSVHLLTLGINVSFIRWPTVPKGADRIRVCLNAGHSRKDVERLAESLVGWAHGILEKQKESHVVSTGNVGEEIVASKL